jgi:sortase A
MKTRLVAAFRSLGSRRAAALAVLLLGLVLGGQGLAIHAKAALAQVLLDRAFTQTLRTGQPVKPWPWADTWPVARIEAPRLGKAALVLEGVSGQALAFGPGHISGTPEAGRPGIAVYAAHRDTHFRFLKDLKSGDDLIVTRADGQVHRFQVGSGYVANWNASGISQQPGPPTLALTTCWPFDGVRHGDLRYVLKAQMVG